MAYNTGNPVPSSDPRDLSDNAQNIDRAANDTSNDFWYDRLGVARRTLSGIDRAGQAVIDGIEDRVDLSTNVVFYDTKEEMDADTSRPNGTRAMVDNDPNPENIGRYESQGGIWSLTEAQPASNKQVEEIAKNLDERISPPSKSWLPRFRLGPKENNQDGSKDWLEITPNSIRHKVIDFILQRVNAMLVSVSQPAWRNGIEFSLGDAALMRVYPETIEHPQIDRILEEINNFEPELKNSPPNLNLALLRQIHMFVGKRLNAKAAQLEIGLMGDSLTDGEQRWARAFATAMMRKFGDAGGGFIGFGWNATASKGNVRRSGSGDSGSVYKVSNLSEDGRWTCNYRNGGGPDLSSVSTSTAGALIVLGGVPSNSVPLTGSPSPNLSRLSLLYNAVAAATLRYRWNSGAWTTLTLAASGGPSSIDFANLPIDNWTLDIEHVSGTSELFGAYAYASTTGVSVSKLGANGTSSLDWASVNPTTFRQSVGLMPLKAIFVLLSTNDQRDQRTAEQVASSMEIIYENLKASKPAADIFFIMPPENLDPTRAPFPMKGYAEEVRKLSSEKRIPFLNLQDFFGSTLDYGPTGVFPLYTDKTSDGQDDLVHWTGSSGGEIVVDAVVRAVTDSL